MNPDLASRLYLLSGVAAMGLGILMTRGRLKQATRVHHRTGSLLSTKPEGWGVWFVQGFADMTRGVGVIAAFATLAFWMLLGMGLVTVGVRLGW